MLPREKLMALGADALTVSELFAILMGAGSAHENVFQLSERITSQPDFQKTLLDRQVEYWTKVPGIGPSKAARLVASVELSKRMFFKPNTITRVSSAVEAFELVRPHILGQRNESFFVICLNTKNVVLLFKKIHEGFTDQVIVDMKMLFSTVLQTGAVSFVCIHNHPSGDVTPSREDRCLTQKIHASAQLLDVHLLDHIVVSAEHFYSLSDREPELFK